MEFDIRLARPEDLPALGMFMRQAYGAQTVFQSPDFLQWFLGRGTRADPDFHLEAQVAVTSDGRVVGHYGGLNYKLWLSGRLVSLVWGVNAYTLPDYRRFGIGKQLVDATASRFDVFGVIGFTPETAHFYDEIGFNIFKFHRFTRYIRTLSEETYAICRLIGQDDAVLRRLLSADTAVPDVSNMPLGVHQITAENWQSLTWNLPQPAFTTTQRDVTHLKWRFFSQTAMRYTVFVVQTDGRITGYAVVRKETVEPTVHQAARIVDLYGESAGMGSLLQGVIAFAQNCGCAYVDFSCFGLLYRTTLLEAGFAELTDNNFALLPQIGATESRPNIEHIGLFSSKYGAEIAALRLEDVYFTRADSDRDRPARLDQFLPLGRVS